MAKQFTHYDIYSDFVSVGYGRRTFDGTRGGRSIGYSIGWTMVILYKFLISHFW